MNLRSILKFTVLLLCLTLSCDKTEINALEFFEVETMNVSDLRLGSAQFNGQLTNIEKEVEGINYGFIYSTETENLDLTQVDNSMILKRDSLKNFPKGGDAFELEINNLDLKAAYYFRAFAKKEERIVYGDVESFSFELNVSISSKEPVRDNDAITLEGLITGLQVLGTGADNHGHVYSTVNVEPTIETDDTTQLGFLNDDGAFFSPLTDLDFQKTYYARSYIVVNGNTIYSPVKEFILEEGWKQLNLSNNPFPLQGSFAAANPNNNAAYIGYGCQDDCNLAVASSKSQINTFSPTLTVQEAAFENLNTCITGLPCRARANAVSFFLNGKLYFGLGDLDDERPKVYFDDFWEYDVDNNTFKAMANYPGGKRTNAVGFVIDDEIYVGTGEDELQIPRDDFYRFKLPTSSNPQGTWEAINALSDNCNPISVIKGRSDAVAFVINNEGYIATGITISCDNHNLWKYNNAEDQWESVGELPAGMKPRSEAVAFSVGNSAFITTGLHKESNTLLNDMWEYNSVSGLWTKRTNLPAESRRNAIGFTIGDNGFIAAGWVNKEGAIFNDYWVYYPSK